MQMHFETPLNEADGKPVSHEDGTARCRQRDRKVKMMVNERGNLRCCSRISSMRNPPTMIHLELQPKRFCVSARCRHWVHVPALGHDHDDLNGLHVETDLEIYGSTIGVCNFHEIDDDHDGHEHDHDDLNDV